MTSSNTQNADSQSNTPSSVYDRKPESTDATPNDDTQIRAARHMDVTFEFESKKWIFGVVALVVLVVAIAFVVVLVVNFFSRLVAKRT